MFPTTLLSRNTANYIVRCERNLGLELIKWFLGKTTRVSFNTSCTEIMNGHSDCSILPLCSCVNDDRQHPHDKAEEIYLPFNVICIPSDDYNPRRRVVATLNQQIIIPGNPAMSLILISKKAVDDFMGLTLFPGSRE
jgi:hypothetical protein